MPIFKLLFILFPFIFFGWNEAQKEKIDIEGPVDYRKKGVEFEGKFYSWSKIRSISEKAHPVSNEKPSEKVLAEFEKKLAILRKKKGNKAKKTTLAIWCKKKGLLKQQWELLIEALHEDGRYRKAIKEVLTITEHRFPKTIGIPPFEGNWLAFVDKTKHHQHKCWGLWAIDFVRVDSDGKWFVGDGIDLSDHYSFGSMIYAFAAGQVTAATNDFPDLPIGKLGSYDTSNSVTIRHPTGEFSVYGHLQKGSVLVKVGDQVKEGEPIGKIGNSGHSNIPHLHFAVMIPAQFQVIEGGRTFWKAQWVGVPYLFKNYNVRDKTRMELARPQEGWILECPKIEAKESRSENE